MKKKLIAITALTVLGAVLSLIFMVGTANAAPTTTTTLPTCGRDQVKVTSTLVDVNNHASVSFTITNGCKLTLGLASYKAPSAVYDPATVSQEVLFQNVAGTFSDDGQTHSLSLAVPDCFYQVDFFVGKVITNFTTTNQYLGNLIHPALNAGTSSCTTPAPADDSSGALGTAAATAGTPANVDATTTTTQPVTTTTVPVAGKALAFTGLNLTPIVIFGALLLAMGAALLASAKHDKFIEKLEEDAS